MTDRRLDTLRHELRSPVAALLAVAEAARTRWQGLDGPSRRRLLELALAAGRDVERLLQERSVVSVRLAPVDAGRIVAEAAESAALAGGAVRADVDEGLPLVLADAQRLRQLLDNLLANALGHSPPGAPVVLAARRRGDGVQVSVTDLGEGIATADLERIFEPGVRLTDARPGAGLGLAIARAIADAHGASLAVTSSPGQGATFTFALRPAGGSA